MFFIHLLYFHSSKSTKKNIKHLYPFRWIILKCTTALYAPEKTIVIPTMHYHSVSFRSILTQVFTKVAYIGFNTRAEEKLGKRIFGPRMSHHGIISVGIEMASPADWTATSAKYQLPPEYLLYVGRVDRNNYIIYSTIL